MNSAPFKIPDKALWFAQIADLRNASYSRTRLLNLTVPGGACVSAIVLALLCLLVTIGTSVLPYVAIVSTVKIAAYLWWIRESILASATQTDAAARRYSRVCVAVSLYTSPSPRDRTRSRMPSSA